MGESTNVRVGFAGFSVSADLPLDALLAKVRGNGRRCLIISRACGLALDTGFQTHQGSWPLLWPPHGLPHQLWTLTGVKGTKSHIISSAANESALDANIGAGRIGMCRVESNASWQRWRLERTSPAAPTYFISPESRRERLTVSNDGEPRWSPWLEKGDGESQEWLILDPRYPSL